MTRLRSTNGPAELPRGHRRSLRNKPLSSELLAAEAPARSALVGLGAWSVMLGAARFERDATHADRQTTLASRKQAMDLP